jgi:hypothetical protein
MKNTIVKILVVFVALAFVGVACKGGGSTAGTSGSSNTLIGQWEGDVEAMKEMNPELAENPMAGLLFAMVGAMKFEFTATQMIVDVMGQKQTVGYKVTSSSGNMMVIEATEGEEAGQSTNVEFMPNNRIKLSQGGSDEPPMVLRRAAAN